MKISGIFPHFPSAWLGHQVTTTTSIYW